MQKNRLKIPYHYREIEKKEKQNYFSHLLRQWSCLLKSKSV